MLLLASARSRNNQVDKIDIPPVDTQPALVDSSSYEIGNGISISDISISKEPSQTARSGYVFQVRGNVLNAGKKELTRAESLGSSLGACLFGKIKDDQEREFNITCSIPPLLPSESVKQVVFAQSTAMKDSESAKFCFSDFNCTLMVGISK